MSFDSFLFLFFFLVVFAATHVLRRRVAARNAFLLVASYYFYACWDWRFLSLIVVSTVIDYACGRALAAPPRAEGAGPGDERGGTRSAGSLTADRRRKAILAVSLVANLGLLGTFKYFDFFTESASALLQSFGLQPNLPTLRVILPVGISFYTFQTLSYTIDVYRRKIPAEPNLLTFALFVAFFPQLVAGPIERASHLLPQFREPRRVSWSDLGSGAFLILWGLFKKVVIADNAADFVDPVFTGEPTSGPIALLGIYAFALQIYCDFSGYSDIARGTARMLGFDVMLNFNLPYLATNPSDFWRRWHISLSTWLRDYLYIPLGGNRKGGARTQLNLMTTMVLGGLWHGASWTFVLWGFYQGVLLVAHRWLEPVLARVRPREGTPAGHAWHVFSIVVFFQLVCGGWLIFRADSIGQIADILAVMATRWPGLTPGWVTFPRVLGLVVCLGLMAAVQVAQYRSRDLSFVYRLPTAARAFVYAGCVLAIILFGTIHGNAFIYFQF